MSLPVILTKIVATVTVDIYKLPRNGGTVPSFSQSSTVETCYCLGGEGDYASA